MTLQDKAHNSSLLVVDDDALVLATLSAGLRDAGYHVIEASSGTEALEIPDINTIDLAILDIRMPVLSGIETAKILYEEHTIPFLFLSAFSDSTTVAEAVNEGALGYLIKPIDVDSMIPTIETALTRSVEIKSLHSSKANLTAALNKDRDVSIAIGIIMANSSFDAIKAEKAMRNYARTNRIKMHDIAKQVIEASDRLKLLINSISLE